MASSQALSSNDVQSLCQRYLVNGESTPWNADAGSSFSVLSYSLEPSSEAPAGFLGCHQFLKVLIVRKDAATATCSKEEVKFFIKSAPSDNASRMEYIEQFGVFKKEIFIYQEVLPRLQNIFPDVAAKCFYADNNILVFENLGELGYRMGGRRDGLLDYTHLNCMLKSLAALHAASIVCEVTSHHRIPELFPTAVEENAYPVAFKQTDQVRVQNFNRANEVLCEIIKAMPKYQANLEYILEEFPKKMQTIFAMCTPSTKYRSVFSHGDLWANNMMFQYGKYSEVPLQCRFVDFQLARYAPPSLDVLTALTIPTSSEFRAQHLSELLDNYYRYLKEFLRQECLHLEEFISRKEFDASVKEFRICGLIESCLFSHLTILPHELTQSLTGSTEGFEDFFDKRRIEICMKAFHSDAVYRERLSDMISDLVDNYILG